MTRLFRTFKYRELFGIFALTALYFLLRLWNLPNQPINDFFDEGVHLALMQEVAEGRGTLYRDLFFIHPPGVIVVGGWLWRWLEGDLFKIRLFYIFLVGLGCVPIYTVARHLYGKKVAFLTLALLATSPGFTNWLGRSVFLEPLLNVPLMGAIWLLVMRRERPIASTLAGAIVGLSFLIKETAAPVGVCLAAALLYADWKSSSSNAWRWFLAGFVPTLALVLLPLLQTPNYFLYTFTLNANDPFQSQMRLKELEHGIYALPFPLLFGVAEAWRMARHPDKREERLLGVFALLLSLTMLLLPKRFYWRYLLPAIPILCLSAAVYWTRFWEEQQPQKSKIAVSLLAGLALSLHCIGVPVYHRAQARNAVEQREALTLLKSLPAPLFTLNPLWASASHKPLPRWRFACDAVFARQYNLASPAEFTSAFRQCPTILLDKKTHELLPPETEAALRRESKRLFLHGKPSDTDYLEIRIQIPKAEQ